MRALVGLFLLSVLLTTGASLDCDSCLAAGTSCSPLKQNCPPGQDICVTIVAEKTSGGQKGIFKSCGTQELCRSLSIGKDFTIAGAPAKIKEFTCKAPASSASLLLALSGLLLLNFLF